MWGMWFSTARVQSNHERRLQCAHRGQLYERPLRSRDPVRKQRTEMANPTGWCRRYDRLHL